MNYYNIDFIIMKLIRMIINCKQTFFLLQKKIYICLYIKDNQSLQIFDLKYNYYDCEDDFKCWYCHF